MPIFRLTAPEGGIQVGNPETLDTLPPSWLTAFKDQGATIRQYEPDDVDRFVPHPGCETTCQVEMQGDEWALVSQYVRFMGGFAIGPTGMHAAQLDRLAIQTIIGPRSAGLVVAHPTEAALGHTVYDLVLHSQSDPYETIR